MTTEAKIQLTSSELGILWMTYQSACATLIKCEFMKDKTIDKEAQNILTSYITEGQSVKDKIVNVFNNEKVVIPIGFDERDIVRGALPLFDDIFNIMVLRQMMKLNFGHSAVFSAMSYMKEVQDILKLNYDVANKYYVLSTNYLLGKGVLAKPPYVTMPKQVEFIEDKNYMSGHNPFSETRSLNTIEVGFLNEAIEDNIFGMQLMTGFSQVATDKDVKKYFLEGKELAKKIISKLSDVLLQSDIQPPSTWAGKATDSTTTPYSDKLMMYTTSLISSSAIGYNALGTSFSMRSDLHTKLSLIAKDTFGYAKKGGKLMIEHKWMEEPPQMEDRNQLTK
ncbi:DUF3231 family protein [Clostridium psychrophilum]|uniref:DUF3231 family protein n=1 Tax=Clostridium psychrophilum TaxID=132926 RepID=UPI001C0ABBEC|nr:DUF3231 family protein [Clostridium psychrophilum]MBU3182216.1 DUF3231 family protein [Clostridium psychrophilum]